MDLKMTETTPNPGYGRRAGDGTSDRDLGIAFADVAGALPHTPRATATGAAVTFNVAVPEIAPCVAVIVVAPPVNEPAPFAVAPVIVASAVLELLQTTDAEISAVLASL